MSFVEKIKSIAESDNTAGSKVCRVKVMFGYKCYIQGADFNDSFFPISNLDSEEGKQEAKTKAIAYIEGLGVNNDLQEGQKKKRPFLIVALVVEPTGVLTGYVYDRDKWFMYPTFAESFNVVAPSLELLPPPGLGEHYVKLGFVPDPSGSTWTDDEGKEKPNMVAFIDTYYPNKEEAQKEADRINAEYEAREGSSTAVQSAGATSDNADFPEGFTKAGWDAFKPDIAKELETRKPKEVADDYSIGVGFVVQVKQEYGL